ncbi:MAG: helix-turn-helix domain-containing protein [Candidatus Thermoplasmatota archaeon]
MLKRFHRWRAKREHPGAMTVAEIAEKLNIPTAEVEEVLKGLEEMGCVLCFTYKGEDYAVYLSDSSIIEGIQKHASSVSEITGYM